MARRTANQQQAPAVEKPSSEAAVKREPAAERRARSKTARERDEALEREQATAAVLRVISRSPENLDAALQAIADTAAALCRADFARLFLRQGDYLVAGPAGAPGGRSGNIQPGEVMGPMLDLPDPALDTASPVAPRLADAIRTGQTIHLVGALLRSEERRWRELGFRPRPGAPRTSLLVPLLRGSEAFGVIVFGRMDAVQPYNDHEIALAEAFAAQAAIAVENARLFEALQVRNREQAEALERDQATAEVLRVISRSPEDLTASLKAVAEAAARLCKGEDALIWLRDGDDLVAGGRAHDVPGLFTTGERLGPISDLNSPAAISARTATTLHIVDMRQWAEQHVTSPEELQVIRDRLSVDGTNSRIVAPLLRGSDVVGVLSILRKGEPAPFTEREITLAETFADQAAIAVENARLFQGIQDRNRELTEALEREQATAEVLRVINRSPENLDASLQAIADTAAPICRADFARVFLRRGDYLVAGPSGPPAGRSGRIQPGEVFGPMTGQPNSALDTAFPIPPSLTRAVTSGRPVHTVDTLPNHGKGWWRPGGPRTSLLIPLLRGSEAVGVIVFGRMDTVQPYNDREIALAETFAEEAAIAVEHARLFDALQERNREQAEALEREQATADVLRVISRSPEDLGASLKAVAEAAARLCKGEDALIWLRDGDSLIAGGRAREVPGVFTPGERVGPLSDRNMPAATAARTAATLHIVDMRKWVEEHASSPEELQEMLDAVSSDRTNSRLVAPLLRGGDVVGVLTILRRGGPAPFTEGEISLAESFADQAAIAVENARLFQGIQERNRELTAALEQQTATADVLRVISEAPADLEAVSLTLVESVGRLVRADGAQLLRVADGQRKRLAATGAVHSAYSPERDNGWLPIVAGSLLDHAVQDKKVVRFFGTDEDRLREYPGSPAWPMAGTGKLGTLVIPLLSENHVVGAFTVAHHGHPLSDRGEAIVGTFADQAVIAMENARLFEELQERNREQAEALEREEATAGVLRVISRSPEDLDASLQAVADTASRLCRADFTRILLRDSDYLVPGPVGAPCAPLIVVGWR